MSRKPENTPARFPRWQRSRLRGPVLWLVRWSCIFALIGLAIVLYYFFISLKYDLDEVAEIPARTVLLDRYNKEIGSLAGTRRQLIEREAIPKDMVNALVAREDSRFYQHRGVDVKGLARATLRNIKDRSFTQGASTLSMQLARNTFDIRAKSIHRKLLEIAITLRIESRYSKDEILTHYLNRIYFGAGCHGIEEASETYFGKSVSQLNTNQCAILAGIIRGPHIYSPFRNLEGAMNQRDDVLARMVAEGYIKSADISTITSLPIGLADPEGNRASQTFIARAVQRQLETILERNDIRDGALTIVTTLDGEMQLRAEKYFAQPISGIESGEISALQGSLMVLQPKDGSVLSMIGSRDYKVSQYNRAYNTSRDIGPLFEPFLHAAARERNKLPIKGKPLQTGRQIGPSEAVRIFRRLGFKNDMPETEDLFRGSLAANTDQLAIATATLQNSGKRAKPYLIKEIRNAHGQVVYTGTSSLTQAIHEGAAADALNSLPLVNKSHTLAGVTNSGHDSWAISSCRDYSAALWLGYDRSKKIGDATSVQKATAQLIEKILSGPPKAVIVE
ncbi:transglycosylase domain-containing protein [Persicirhabdus sediminis]|uniref:Transglycosylase domain-containing protein n=1 Tax=Persicirhabdus sediminis TaxID=454144 RepID=A0A8J7ME75_9BACT|nr:transglycosylase domain-containing protein [Persicirhabdus sediminis]MBK1791108.1 transglycosylase domain-containing protein [Persicirhabdus sediminis]